MPARRAKLRVQQRISPQAALLSVLRWLVAVALTVALVWGVKSARATSWLGVGGAEDIATVQLSPSPTPTEVSPSPSPPSVSPLPSLVPASPSPSPTPADSSLSGAVDLVPRDLAPVADAGGDQVVNPGSLVVLDGTRSWDPERTTLGFSWRQLDGPSVLFDSPSSATPSFTAGDAGDIYLFSLTVRDGSGVIGTDRTVVAARQLAAVPAAAVARPVVVVESAEAPRELSAALRPWLYPLNALLFVLSTMIVLLAVFDRFYHTVSVWRIRSVFSAWRSKGTRHRVQVVHYQTGEGIAGVRVVVLATGGTVVGKHRAGLHGMFSLPLEPGSYAIRVETKGFALSPAAASLSTKDDDVLYTGGRLEIPADQALSVVIPMKPTGEAVGLAEKRFLKKWQAMQRHTHWWSWPVFVTGAALNTTLMLWLVASHYLVFELGYVGLLLLKILLELRLRPSYGFVRDAITHVPLDLAVVRMYEHGTNRLILTRVTDEAGRFFALPPGGVYNVVVSKPGYATFSKDNVAVSGKHDTTLRIRADLMPSAPLGVLASAANAV
jgi:hypothetical protein